MTKYLNAKEYDILDMILHSEEPLNVSQILKLRPQFTSNIVQPVIRKLLKFKLIEVADITMDGNIFSRRFRVTESAPDTIRKMFQDDYIHFSKLVSGQSLMSAMVEANDNPGQVMEEIGELEKLLQEYKGKNHNFSKDKSKGES